MRLRSIAFRGLTRFTDSQPVRVDLDSLGPGLVAIVGPNGAGKSTFLEAVPAALYDRFPSRPGSLYNYTHGKDAFIEAEFLNGGPPEHLKVRVQVDAERRTTERYVFLNDVPLTTGRAEEFEREVDKHFGSRELFLASAFAAQNKAGNFLTMDRKDRKDLFAQLLNLGRLQVLAVAARDRRVAAETDLSSARRTAAIIQEELEQKPALEEGLTIATAAAEKAAGELATAQQEEAAAISALERAKGLTERINALHDAYRGAAARKVATDLAVEAAEGMEPKAREGADKRLRLLNSQDPAEVEKRARERHDSSVTALQDRERQARATIAEEEKIKAAAAEVRALEALYNALQARERAERRFEDAVNLNTKTVEGLRTRARLMETAPCTVADRWAWTVSQKSQKELGGTEPRDLAGTCPLLKDARESKLKIATTSVDPASIKTLDATRNMCLEALAVAGWQDQVEGESLDTVMNRVAGARQRASAVASRAGLVTEARKQLTSVATERKRLDEVLASDLTAARGLAERLQAQRDSVAEDLGLALLDAQQAVTAAGANDRAAEEALAKVEQELAAAKREGDGANAVKAEANLKNARAARQTADAALRQAEEARIRLRAALERLGAQEEALAEHRAEVAVTEVAAADWTTLEDALGRNGVQALEIDAAGPEVSKLTNDLLGVWRGVRFSITLETLREKKSEPGQYTEAFDVRVFDEGRERQVEALSGGERVIVSEAMGLAIAIFNARKSGIQWRTLFRDETAGALDPENAQAYVDMLRRALELGGFEQVLFVSHAPEVWERADARLRVEHGRINVAGMSGGVEGPMES